MLSFSAIGLDAMKTIEKLQYIFKKITALNQEPLPSSGLPEDEILSRLRAIGISPPKELVQLYEWHNGIGYLNAFLHLWTINEAINCYSMFHDFKDEFPDFEWQESWYPVLTTNGDVHHCVDLISGAVVDIDMEGDVVRKLADHYGYFLDAIIHVFENDLVQFDSAGGFIECKNGEWLKVAEKFNVKATHW